MKLNKMFLFVAFATVFCVGQAAAARAQSKVEQKVLFEKVVELHDKNVNVKVRHVKFPVGFKTPEHTHKGPGPRYVLKGKMEVIEGGATGTYGAGEVFWEYPYDRGECGRRRGRSCHYRVASC